MKSKRKAVPGLSPEAQAVWDRLDEKTKGEIRKENPFKVNRNRAVRELVRDGGLTGAILQELTGLNQSSIYRIVGSGDDIPDYAKREVKGLIKAFQSFLNSLSVVLADKYRKGGDRKTRRSN